MPPPLSLCFRALKDSLAAYPRNGIYTIRQRGYLVCVRGFALVCSLHRKKVCPTLCMHSYQPCHVLRSNSPCQTKVPCLPKRLFKACRKALAIPSTLALDHWLIHIPFCI